MGLALGLIVLFSFVVLEHILDVSSASTGSSSIVRSKTKSAPRPRCSQQQLAFPNGPRLLAGEPKSSHPGPAKCGSLPGAMRLLIGRSGLLGYVLQLEWLYQWYRFNSMVLSPMGSQGKTATKRAPIEKAWQTPTKGRDQADNNAPLHDSLPANGLLKKGRERSSGKKEKQAKKRSLQKVNEHLSLFRRGATTSQ